MHPLKFIEASNMEIEMEGVHLQSPACHGRLREFQENVRLALGLVSAPGFSILVMFQWSQAGTEAAHEIFKENWSDKFPNASQDDLKRFWIATNKNMEKLVRDSSPLLRPNLTAATKTLEQVVMRCGPFAHGILEGILKALCIQAWTAMEVLFEDLHSSALDLHGASFKPEVRDKHAKQQFRFRRRDHFRDAYDFAFEHDLEINETLASPSIDALAAVRHLLAKELARACAGR